MREVTVAGTTYKIQASPITLWIYKKRFNEDLLAQLAKMENANKGGGEVDASQIGFFDLVQMIWAMAKTANPTIVDFEPWLASMGDELDFMSIDYGSIISELLRGFFRGGAKDEAATKEVGAQE